MVTGATRVSGKLDMAAEGLMRSIASLRSAWSLLAVMVISLTNEAFAEVMDKELSLGEIWTWSAILVGLASASGAFQSLVVHGGLADRDALCHPSVPRAER